MPAGSRLDWPWKYHLLVLANGHASGNKRLQMLGERKQAGGNRAWVGSASVKEVAVEVAGVLQGAMGVGTEGGGQQEGTGGTVAVVEVEGEVEVEMEMAVDATTGRRRRSHSETRTRVGRTVTTSHLTLPLPMYPRCVQSTRSEGVNYWAPFACLIGSCSTMNALR